MTTTHRTLLPGILLLLAAAVAFGAIIKDRPTAYSNGTDIVIRWNTEDESGVHRFEVHRRGGASGEFTVIGSLNPKGNNSSYEFYDRSAFRANAALYQYKIRVINDQLPYPETEIVTVSHVSSAAKRTWGSIKAMFR